IVLDTGPLGMAVRGDKYPPFARWLRRTVESGILLCVPEIADYELRRGYLLKGWLDQTARLDELGKALRYVPLTTSAIRRAAGFWADARRNGIQTAPDPALDGDVILAAQTLELAASLQLQPNDVIVATDNVGHLGRYVDAQRWSDSQ
ncbi:MAG: hypothetical protein ACRDG4_09835, partial [Chloroflexota bacterium]